jgi:hypothetical protein
MMPTDPFIITSIAVAIFASLVGFGTFLSLQIVKPSPSTVTVISPGEPEPVQLSQPCRNELRHCLNLADCVARDADLLASMLAQPALPSSHELDSALQQILKTMRIVAGRLERVGNGETPAIPDPAPQPLALPNREFAPKAKEQSAAAAEETSPARAADDRSYENARKHPRTPCPGSFKATIYPPPFNPAGEPFQCTLRIRDLSCGGIGILHTEQLYPKQIIVLHAVTKLLIGEVRWCRQTGERSYIAGCQLVKASGGEG